MKIKELSIRDFGIIKNETVKNITSNIVVIGGGNRAGKSTLMKVIRHLPYGFKKGKEYKLPESEDEYCVRCKIEHNDKPYTIKVKGYSGISIEDSEGRLGDFSDICNDIDLYTYKNLYTVSLDELRKDVTLEDDKMRPVLLGAGLKSMVKINEALKDFNKRAEIIGGTQGKPEVGKFKEYSTKISTLTKEKNKINSERNEYLKLKEKVKHIEQEIARCNEQICIINSDIRVNMFLRENYSDYKEVKGANENQLNEFLKSYSSYGNKAILGKDLLEEYEKQRNKYNELKENITMTIHKDIEKTEVFFKYKDLIRIKYNSLERLKGDIDNLKELQSGIMRKKEKLYLELKNINSNFYNIQEIKQMTFDKQREEVLKYTCENYEKLKKHMEEKQKEITQIESRKNILKENTSFHKKSKWNHCNSYTITLVCVILLGICIFNKNSTLGLFIILGGMISIVVFQIIIYLSSRDSHKGVQLLNDEIKRLSIVKSTNIKEIERLKIEFEVLEENIDVFREEYKIEYNAPLSYIIEVFHRLRSLQESATEVVIEEGKINSISKRLNLELREIKIVVSDIAKEIPKYMVDSLNQESIINSLEVIFKDFIRVEEFREELSRQDKLEEKIINTFMNIDSYKPIYDYVGFLLEAIKICDQYENKKNLKVRIDTIKNKLNCSFEALKVNIVDVKEATYEELFNKYLSIEELHSIKDEFQRKYEQCEALKDSLVKNKVQLEEKLCTMENEDRLMDIIKNIQNERNDLIGLAKEYAVNRLSQRVLQRVLRNVMDETKNNIASSWSSIISNITSGDISKIDLDIKDDNLLYSLYSSEEKNPMDVELLSRGTAEQLFLSARLNRLKNIEEHLPVVFDDAFVNFDNNHMRNVLKELKEISESKQIFILTCHKEVIEAISEEISGGQYFFMENGRIEEMSKNKLCDKLT